MRRLCLAGLLLASACASSPLKPADATALVEADAKVLQGCYDCLLEARTTYARVAVGKARPLVIARLFETDLLITLRERELALDSSKALGEAQTVAKELPPTFGSERILAMVDGVPGDDLGWTHRETNAWRRAHVDFSPKVNDELQWLATSSLSPPVRTYLNLAVDCAYPYRTRPNGSVRMSLPDLPSDAPPLIVYRQAICVNASLALLTKVRDEVPRFVETGYFLSRAALVNVRRTGGGNARQWLGEAYKRFPMSPSVTYLTGNFNQLVGDCRAAITFYDDTLVFKPEHENALLGRTICLTYLKQTDEAIAEATHMIEIRTDNIDLAYYYRAWNYHSRQQLDLARADIETAKRTHVSSDILTLAGMIEHDQNDLGPAEKDLLGARDMSSLNCVAMWYLGLVMIKKEDWIASGKQFEDAMGCYETSVKDDEDGLREMQNRTDVDEDFRTRQIAGFEAALTEDRSHQYAAAFNAANQYAHGGNVAKARALVDVAARDPALAALVADLKRIIGGTM